jgi:hypothetical protein
LCLFWGPHGKSGIYGGQGGQKVQGRKREEKGDIPAGELMSLHDGGPMPLLPKLSGREDPDTQCPVSQEEGW